MNNAAEGDGNARLVCNLKFLGATCGAMLKKNQKKRDKEGDHLHDDMFTISLVVSDPKFISSLTHQILPRGVPSRNMALKLFVTLITRGLGTY